MATGKKDLGVRSVTYLVTSNMKSNNKTKLLLRRMNSFDSSYEDLGEERTAAREVSAEGRLRTHHFLYAHSCSTTLSSSSSTLSSSSSMSQGQKLLRFSDERWCGPAMEQRDLAYSRSRQRSASHFRDRHSSVERLLDWKRHSPERCNSSLSPGQRQSRSSERRHSKNSSTTERRSQFCSSISLPPSARPPTDTDSTSSSSATTQVSSEGRKRRSQFRRAWSLFSLAFDKDAERERREKSPQQRILRAPTRHIYRRGLSGLPIECSSTTLGLAY